MQFQEIGTIEAILVSITTLKDLSCKISFEINPDNIQVINKLMQNYLVDKRLFTIGIVQSIDKPELNDE